MVIAVSDTDPQPRKARGQLFGRALAPGDRAPGFCRQAQSELLDRDRPMIGITPYQLRRPSGPDQALGCNGAVPGAHTVVFGKMPAT